MLRVVDPPFHFNTAWLLLDGRRDSSSGLPTWPKTEKSSNPGCFPPAVFVFGKALCGESGDGNVARSGVVSQVNQRVYARRVGVAWDQARDEVGVSGVDFGRFALGLSDGAGLFAAHRASDKPP